MDDIENQEHIHIWCVLNGDKYSEMDVATLADMVLRNISAPHSFHCLTDRDLDIHGVHCVNTVREGIDFGTGWWTKLFLPHFSTGYCIYLDLDVAIVGDLAGLVDLNSGYRTLPAAPRNWAQSGHDGIQSSVLAWHSEFSWSADDFYPDRILRPTSGNCGLYEDIDGELLHGDQCFLTKRYGNPGQPGGMNNFIEMSGVYSYKYHCRGSEDNAPPDDAIVVAFHGLPKPDDVRDRWVIEARNGEVKH